MILILAQDNASSTEQFLIILALDDVSDKETNSIERENPETFTCLIKPDHR